MHFFWDNLLYSPTVGRSTKSYPVVRVVGGFPSKISPLSTSSTHPISLKWTSNTATLYPFQLINKKLVFFRSKFWDLCKSLLYFFQTYLNFNITTKCFLEKATFDYVSFVHANLPVTSWAHQSQYLKRFKIDLLFFSWIYSLKTPKGL